MFDHLGLTVRDVGRSREFYAAALAPLGLRVLMEHGQAIAFGQRRPQFWLSEGEPAQPARQTHVAFIAATRSAVDAFHRAALAAGGQDNGPPGPRPQYHEHYYGAFILDPDGYNVEAVCHDAPILDRKELP